MKCKSHYIPPAAFTGAELPQVCDSMIDLIMKSGIQFDAIAFTGLSGALVAPIVAFRLGKNLIGVRKKGETKHTCDLSEGYLSQNYIIIDDFIDTEATCKRIIDEINDSSDEPGKCVGIFLYTRGWCNDHFPVCHNGETIPVFRGIL